jgi:gliding motility-associated-like protein
MKFIRTFLITILVFIPILGFCQIATPKWVDDIGGPSSNCISSAVKVDKQNNVYVTGFYDGTADFDPSSGVYNLTASGGGFDTFIAKYTSAGALIWAKTIGGSGTDQVNSMTVDINGNAIISGQYSSPTMAVGSTTLQNNGEWNSFVVKINTNGGFVWAKSIGGSSTDYGAHIESDSQGNIIQNVRYTSSSITVGANTYGSPSGSFNGITIKYDPTGNVVWAINLADSGDSESIFGEFDSQNNVVITGHFSGNDNFNPLGTAYNLNGNGNASFIAKYNSSGILQWVTSINGTVVGNNLNLCINSKDDIYVDGPFSSPLSFGSITLNPSGSQDIFMSKYSSAGVFQSAKDIGSSGGSIFNYGIVSSKDDYIYLSGYFSGTVDFDPSPTSAALTSDHGDRDFLLAKYDSNLNYKWVFNGGSACDQNLGRNVCIDNNNDVLYTGGFCSQVNFSASICTPVIRTAQSGSRDCFLAKYTQAVASAQGEITSFSVPQQTQTAVIDQTNLIITVTVPTGTNVTALIPTIAYTNSATIAPASGVAHDFTAPVTYALSANCNAINYTVNVVFAGIGQQSICSGSSVTLTGGTLATTPDSYTWQVLQSNVWVNASGTINTKDYTSPVINNTTSAPVIYSYRRQLNTKGVISIDSRYDVTVIPAVANNSVTAPAVTSFCANADPANIVGSTPTGGSGTYTYQWQSSTDNTNFTNISGATAKDYDPPAITKTTYYRRTVISGACSTPLISNVVAITVLAALTTPVPTSAAVSVCIGSTASLSVASPQAGVTYNWYDSAAKTTLLHAGATYTTSPLTSNATYYIEATNGLCSNSSLASVNVTVVALPSAPVLTVNSTQACYGSKVTLTYDDTQGGHYNWYTTPTGGTAVATGVTFVTAAITQNTTYYVENVNSTGCISATRTRYDITVVPLPTAPQVQVPAPVCYGTPAVLSIINPQAGLTYNWYTVSTGGTSVATGATFTTPNLTANTTYYAEAVNSNSCASSRTLVTIPITPLPTAPQLIPPVPICSGSSETLSVANPQTGITYNWYNSSTKTTLLHSGTTYNTGPLLINTAYFVEATNGSCANASLASVQVNVVQLPLAPVITLNNLQTCYGTQVTYVDNTPQNGQYSWYTVPTGGTPIFTGITYVSAPLTQNTTYYVENVNSNGCVSTTRTRVDITINPAPQAPQVQAPAPVCYGTPVALNIINPQAGLTYNWYTTSAGGLPLVTGSTFTTANLTANVTYYAEAANSNSCPSSRTPVNVTVIPVPTAPQVKTPVPICNGSIESLAIVNPQTGVTYNWYAAATAGTILGAGTTFNTLPLTTSTSYYVEAVSNTAGCISPTRTLAAVIVTQPPVTPVAVTPTVSVCAGSAATIAIASPQAGVVYNWYSSPAKTTLLFTGSNYTTKPITANTTYYIEAVNGPCTSPSTGTAQVNVIALPGVPAVVKSLLQTCSGTQVTLSIANPQLGITYNWYKTATGGTSVFTGPDFLTPELTGNTTYYAEAANSNSCVSATRAPVTISVTPAPGISTQSISICPGEKGVIFATTDDKDATISWYASATSTTVLATGSSFTTPVLNNNAIYYAEAVDNASGCISVTRSVATVTMYKQLAAPIVSVAKTTVTSVTFEWPAVSGASGYQVSIDGGKTFTNPSSGASGLSHTVTGLTLGLRVTIIVEATGVSTCQLSGSSTAITGIAHDEKTDVIYVANAFTPNGDGVNDVVYVHSEVIKSLNFYIYDQWGELLFKTSSKDAGWDGTYKGTKQPVGVYVYYVEALMNDGQKITKKGTITLLR